MLKVLTLALAGFLLAAVSPRAVSAQDEGDCGNECDICGVLQWEGTAHDDKGPYNMTCIGTGEGGGCSKSGCGAVEATRGDWISAGAIAEVITAASASELPALLEAYGDRLLYVPERQAVAIRGIACAAERIDRMVMLPRDKALAFAKLDVRLAKDFLAEKKRTPVVLAQTR